MEKLIEVPGGKRLKYSYTLKNIYGFDNQVYISHFIELCYVEGKGEDKLSKKNTHRPLIT